MQKILLLLMLLVTTTVSAAGTGTMTPVMPSQPSPAAKVAPLALEKVTAVAAKQIQISFTDSVMTDSVLVRINKQSDNSSLLTQSIVSSQTGSLTDKVLTVNLRDALEENSSYRLTVISAISENGVNIKEGVDAVQEFSTEIFDVPETLNAPTNENAVLTSESTGTTTSSTVVAPLPEISAGSTGAALSESGSSTSTGETMLVDEADALPATGVNPLILLVFVLPIVILFAMKRRRA